MKLLLEAENKESIREKWLEIEESNRPLIVILDQLEEAYTQSTPNDANSEFSEFFETLSNCFNSKKIPPKGKIILSYRKEYHSEIEAFADDSLINYNRYPIQRLEKKGMVQAIEGICKAENLQFKYGLTIEKNDEVDLAWIIANDLWADVHSALAPVLQILLSRMWEISRNSEEESERIFSLELYQRLKNKGILLNNFFDQQIEKLALKHLESVKKGLILNILYSYTTSLSTAKVLETQKVREQFGGAFENVSLLLQSLEDSYLITSVDKTSKTLSHDTLGPIIQDTFYNSTKIGQQAMKLLQSKNLGGGNQDIKILNGDDLEIIEEAIPYIRILTENENNSIVASRKEMEKKKNEIRRQRIIGFGLIVFFSSFAAFLWYQNKGSLNTIYNIEMQSFQDNWDALKFEMAEAELDTARQLNVNKQEIILGYARFLYLYLHAGDSSKAYSISQKMQEIIDLNIDL